jgi:hypothetical protein
MKEKYLGYVNNLLDSYDAFYFQNKYSEADKTTHSEEFVELGKLLKEDDTSMRALGWIKNCYDCYYKADLEKPENKDNAFNYLKNKIEEIFKEEN